MGGGKGVLKVGLNFEHFSSFFFFLFFFLKLRRWQTGKHKPTMPLGLVFLSMFSLGFCYTYGGFGSIIVLYFCTVVYYLIVKVIECIFNCGLGFIWVDNDVSACCDSDGNYRWVVKVISTSANSTFNFTSKILRLSFIKCTNIYFNSCLVRLIKIFNI